MCEYCSRKPEFCGNEFYQWHNEEMIDGDNYTLIAIGVDRNGRLIIRACGEGEAYYYPKFCPECGREL